MKVASLVTLSLLFASAASKYCLDTKGRFTPRIFLGQSVIPINTPVNVISTNNNIYGPFAASMSAQEDPMELHAVFDVGSYRVSREMGIDTDSPMTIIQADNVTVTTDITVDPYYEDVL